MLSNNEFLLPHPKLWYQIEERFQHAGGVYILFCKETIIKPVNRLLATDTEGRLYIGMAKSFLDRTIELKKSISPDYISSNHECGVRYKSNKGILKMYPYQSLYLKLLESKEPRKLEEMLLKEYCKEFGELPPLNRVG